MNRLGKVERSTHALHTRDYSFHCSYHFLSMFVCHKVSCYQNRSIMLTLEGLKVCTLLVSRSFIDGIEEWS